MIMLCATAGVKHPGRYRSGQRQVVPKSMMKLQKGLLQVCIAFLHLHKHTLSQQTLARFLSENQTSPAPRAALLLLPGVPRSDPAAHILALVRLRCLTSRPAGKPSFSELFCRIAFRAEQLLGHAVTSAMMPAQRK